MRQLRHGCNRFLRVAVAGLLALLLLAPATQAHDPGMSAATLLMTADHAELELSVKGADLGRAAGLDLVDAQGMVVPERLEAQAELVWHHLDAHVRLAGAAGPCPIVERRLDAIEDGVLATLRFACSAGTPGLTYRTTLLQDVLPSTVQSLLLIDGDAATPIALDRDSPAIGIGPPLPLWAVLWRYVAAGMHHLLAGPDHLAFLVALLLPARRLAPVVATVTAFTLAHSLTLGLATLGLVTPPGRLIEPLIALTVTLAALANLRTRPRGTRWPIAFLLGLVHGFGLAGSLIGLGLEGRALATALLGFNLGIEIAQLAVVAFLVPALLLLDRLTTPAPARPRRSRGLVRLLSLGIAGFGIVWLIRALSGGA